MKKFKLLKNAAILTVTGFLLRGLGMALRIYISSRIGEEGMGVYQLITSAHFLFITLAQSGLSVTVTRLAASRFALSDKDGGKKAAETGVCIALLLGTFAAAAMLLLAKPIALCWIGDSRSLSALYVLAFSLPPIAVCSVLSGYFIAQKNVIYGCSAQILEQVSRMAVAMASFIIFKDRQMSVILAAVLFANTVSECISCLYLGVCYLKEGKRGKCTKTYTGQIIKGAYPVALSRYLASGLHTGENMLVPSAIAMYTKSRTLALEQFGALKGMALPLLFFPYSFLNALSTLLVPEITGSYAKGEIARTKTLVERTCRITITLSAMAGGAFFLFADSFGMLIYNSQKVVIILKYLAPIVPFMYLDSVCDGLLKGLGRQKQVLYNNCIDSAVRIVLIALLVPKMGIVGFLLVMVVSNVTVSLLNFALLIRTSGVRCRIFSWWIAPLGFVVASSFITNFLTGKCATVPKTILGCSLFCLIYACFAVFFGFKNKKSENY